MLQSVRSSLKIHQLTKFAASFPHSKYKKLGFLLLQGLEDFSDGKYEAVESLRIFFFVRKYLEEERHLTRLNKEQFYLCDLFIHLVIF